MAHVRKFNLAQTGHMFTHYRRGATHYSNSDVDMSKTMYNYSLGPIREKTDKDYLLELLNKVDHANRRDLVVMADWVIDAPADLNKEDYDDFFKLAYAFCSDRYGKLAGFSNQEDVVLSAYVHMDETTPHLHFSFAPIIMDNKGKQRFRAKSVICRSDLQCFHKDLEMYIREHGLRCRILNGKTQRDSDGRALSVKELKIRNLRRDRLKERGRF